jgi:O-antigen/teichoic acid export membrane protein
MSVAAPWSDRPVMRRAFRILSAQAAAPQNQATAIQLAGAGLSFLAYAAIARLFGPSISGQYAIMVQTVIASSAIALFGHDQLLARGIAASLATNQPGAARQVLLALGRFSALLLLAMAALTWLAGPALERIGMAHDAQLLVPLAVVLYGALRFVSAGLRGAMLVRAGQVVLSLQPVFLLVGIAIVTAQPEHFASALAWAYTGSLLLPAVLALWALALVCRHWPSKAETGADAALRDRTSVGLVIVVTTLFGWGIMALLGYIFDNAAMGIYQLCLQLQLPFSMIFTSYATAVGPDLAQAYARGDREKAWRLYRQHRRFLLAVTAIPLAAITLFAPQILALFGEGFVAGATALRLFMVAMAINMVFATATIALVMDHRDREYLGVTLGSIALAAAALVVLLPTYALEGVAAANVVQAIALYGGCYVVMRRRRG